MADRDYIQVEKVAEGLVGEQAAHGIAAAATVAVAAGAASDYFVEYRSRSSHTARFVQQVVSEPEQHSTADCKLLQ